MRDGYIGAEVVILWGRKLDIKPGFLTLLGASYRLIGFGYQRFSLQILLSCNACSNCWSCWVSDRQVVWD